MEAVKTPILEGITLEEQEQMRVCNDVVGDICGIVSGSTAAVIVTHLQRDLSTTSVLISIGATALISGITIGGKALGKTVAINQCTSVVYRVARIMHALHLSR